MIRVTDVKDFNRCCRCCLMIGNNMRPLFEAAVGQMYNCIMPNKALEHDGYPQQACQRCILKLSSAYCFQQAVIANQETLLQLYEATLQKLKAKQSSEILIVDDMLIKPADIENAKVVNECDPMLIVDIENAKVVNESDPMQIVDIENAKVVNESDPMQIVDIENAKVVNESDPMLIADIENAKIIADNGMEPEAFNIDDHFARSDAEPLDFFIDDPESDVKKEVQAAEDGCEFKCFHCNKPLEKAVGNKVQRITCDTCPRVDIREDTKKSNKGTSHLCNHCGKTYKVRTSLLKHLRYHRSKNLFICNICEKTFLYVKELHIHVRSHLGVKPFKCPKCNAKFSQLGSLNKHLLAHNQTRPYKCSICHRQFLQKAHYANHARVHTDEKPYKCDLCGKEYRWRASLLSHKKSHGNAAKLKRQQILNEDITTSDLCFTNHEEMFQQCENIHENVVHIDPVMTCTLNVQNLISKIVHDSL